MTEPKAVIEVLNKIKSQIPVEWDRWTKSSHENPYYCVYGWIDRKDGKRDFLCIQMFGDSEMEDVHFVTSSAKYSAKIHEIITGRADGHSDCHKIEELHGYSE